VTKFVENSCVVNYGFSRAEPISWCAMTFALSVHDCRAVRIEQLMPANANCVSLVIDSAEGKFSINLYDLPDSAVATLIAALGRPQHVDHTAPVDLISEVSQANIMAAVERARRRPSRSRRCQRTWPNSVAASPVMSVYGA
jgi:hypothetical protein